MQMPLVIAHRGASLVRPENTIEAFQEARRLGADMVELDARCTADGAVAVHHDPVLPGAVALSTLASDQLFSEIPLLGAALAACAGMGVNVELKDLPGDPGYDPSYPLVDAVLAVVDEAGAAERVLLSSFDLAAVDRARAQQPSVPTAWLILAGYEPAEAVATCTDHGHVALHPHHLVTTPELIELAHDAGLAVNTWTVDDPDRIRLLAGWGVDGICTNAPDVAVAVLEEAGLRGRRS